MAVLGTGGQATRVAVPTIRAAAGVELVGLAGSDPARTAGVAQEMECAALSLDEVLRGESADTVWIAVRNDLHADLAIECLDAGLHVLVEKPMAINVEQSTRVVEAAAKASTVLRVAYQHRFRDAHQRLRGFLHAGEFGELGQVRLHRNWRFPYFEGQQVADLYRWRNSDEASGGWAINDIGSHLVDLIAWLLPGDLSLLAAWFTHRFPEIDNDSTAFLTLRTGSAALVSIETSNVLISPGSLLEIYGEGGWARATDSFHEASTTQTSFSPDFLDQTTGPDVYRRMLEDFIFGTWGGPMIGADAHAGLVATQLIEQARASGTFLDRA